MKMRVEQIEWYETFSRDNWPEFSFSVNVDPNHVTIWANGNGSSILRERFDALVDWYIANVRNAEGKTGEQK